MMVIVKNVMTIIGKKGENMSRRYRRSNDDMGWIAWALLAVVALPIVGIYMLLNGKEHQKALGIVLIIVGIILWGIFGIIG